MNVKISALAAVNNSRQALCLLAMKANQEDNSRQQAQTAARPPKNANKKYNFRFKIRYKSENQMMMPMNQPGEQPPTAPTPAQRRNVASQQLPCSPIFIRINTVHIHRLSGLNTKNLVGEKIDKKILGV